MCKFAVRGNANPLTEDLHHGVKHLSAELYTKDVHFLMELIKSSAENNEYPLSVKPSLEFVFTKRDITGVGATTTLLIFNNEKGFSKENIESLSNVVQSTKKGKRQGGYIGEKDVILHIIIALFLQSSRMYYAVGRDDTVVPVQPILSASCCPGLRWSFPFSHVPNSNVLSLSYLYEPTTMEYKFAGKSKAGGDTQKERQHSPPMEEGMTFDDIYMQRSSRFLDSVQELKNLRPQLYHAAEYFELSYFRNQQKRMVLHNSKDYAVKALVNAVDHVGSVASKLNDLLTQETDEISATELRIDCLKQVGILQGLLMCREHTDHKGITEQCLAKSIPRYHRHYVLPEAGISEAGTRSEWYIVQDSEQARLPPMRLGTSLFLLLACIFGV
eukprot:Gb_17259 [translate_table: standard]